MSILISGGPQSSRALAECIRFQEQKRKPRSRRELFQGFSAIRVSQHLVAGRTDWTLSPETVHFPVFEGGQMERPAKRDPLDELLPFWAT